MSDLDGAQIAGPYAWSSSQDCQSKRLRLTCAAVLMM
jgi:hypothetical protein